jgi:hypothetical protein
MQLPPMRTMTAPVMYSTVGTRISDMNRAANRSLRTPSANDAGSWNVVCKTPPRGRHRGVELRRDRQARAVEV